jgi:hypothetical protein
MKEFKFFKGTLDMIDGDVRATASFNVDTPEGHVNRRMLYHTDHSLYDRLRDSNNEMEQYFYDRNLRSQFGTPERHQDILRRISEQRDLINTDNQRGFFQPITVTKVNPKWWMKIKMFFQNLLLYSDQVAGIAVIATTITFIVILTISKLLNAW